jgi:NAD-dependent deacetylase
MANWLKDIDAAVDIWRAAGPALVLTGAGISVASGIPDFRSPGGLWSRFDPDRTASAWALRHNPDGVWAFLHEALRVLAAAEPNPGHQALAELERGGLVRAVVTQNIDGLHGRAGSRRVVEFHGGMSRWFCMGCGADRSLAEALALEPEDLPWRCGCGGLIRPDVVFFGEDIPPQALLDSRAAASGAALAVVVGTSGEVAPANLLPRLVKERGGTVIEVNLGESQFGSLTDLRLAGPAELVLPEILKRLGP